MLWRCVALAARNAALRLLTGLAVGGGAVTQSGTVLVTVFVLAYNLGLVLFFIYSVVTEVVRNKAEALGIDLDSSARARPPQEALMWPLLTSRRY